MEPVEFCPPRAFLLHDLRRRFLLAPVCSRALPFLPVAVVLPLLCFVCGGQSAFALILAFRFDRSKFMDFLPFLSVRPFLIPAHTLNAVANGQRECLRRRVNGLSAPFGPSGLPC